MSRSTRIACDFWEVCKSLKVENLGVMPTIALVEGGVGESLLAISFFVAASEGLSEY